MHRFESRMPKISVDIREKVSDTIETRQAYKDDFAEICKDTQPACAVKSQNAGRSTKVIYLPRSVKRCKWGTRQISTIVKRQNSGTVTIALEAIGCPLFPRPSLYLPQKGAPVATLNFILQGTYAEKPLQCAFGS